ncbi:hypothetical protein QCM77_34550 [Bradyrhizobium sp. SSUT18]|nr:hypothetical protein [Bradyrhizobium sp. SSUT18]MDH2405002.1 hypothetical protein [Bradyrhizobium sp. SSUT18]
MAFAVKSWLALLAEPIVPLLSAAIPQHAAAGKVADADYDSLFIRL